jgi:predicted dehydrogenase
LSLRVAIIGAGGISREQHVPSWLDVTAAELVAVADPSQQALDALRRGEGIKQLERYQDRLDIEWLVTDYRPLLDDPSIDVIDICVPSALHEDLTVAALEAGKHVICEKPMATSRQGVARILAAHARASTKYTVLQNMRVQPSVTRLRDFLGPTGLGDVYYARTQWLRRRLLPGRPGFVQKSLSGGGALFDIGVHAVDLAWWMMGCPLPLSASGSTFDRLAHRPGMGTEWGQWSADDIDVEDFAAGMIRFATGATLTVEASWLGFQPEREIWRLQLFGTEAGALWPDNRVVGERDGRPWDIQLPAGNDGSLGHATAIASFARAIVDDTPVAVPPHESATVIAMLEALYRSAVAGRDVEVEPFAVPAVHT